MAKVKDPNLPHIGGKMNKKSDVVYRTRNGKQYKYTFTPSTKPPTKAQNAYRKNFGKITTIVNAILANPEQKAEWQVKMKEFNQHQRAITSPLLYKTTRQFVFAMIREQLEKTQSVKRRRKPIQLALPKGLKLHVKPFSELSTTELYELLKARFIVFYSEQNCRYLDMDDVDYKAIHLALHRKGRVIAYARLYEDSTSHEWHVGRLLSLERGKGFGKYIMQQVENQAILMGASSLSLHAQTQVVPFYEALGYTPYGSVFIEADIPHLCMKKSLIK